MRRLVTIVLVAFALGMLVLALTRSTPANASALYTSPYSFEQTFGTSLRFIRVDMGFRVIEKDKDAGFILFDYTSPESGNKAVPGSLELVETSKGVQVTAQIPAMPQYHEQMVIDQLAKKLETEHGRPISRKEKEKPSDKDKGKDSDKDKGKDKDKDGDKDGDKDKDKDAEKDGDKDRNEDSNQKRDDSGR